MAKVVIRVARNAGIIILFIVAAVLGTASGVIFAFAGDLPRISALDDYAPSTISRVYGSKGEIVGEFAIQRREVIPYDAISPKLHDAILAAEDDEFEQHFGLSIPHIAMALMKDIIERRKAGGASTLTQQLARKLFLTDEKTWERKVKEALLAIQIEKRYTKREIFALYANQMYLGEGAYGVEAAARTVLWQVRTGSDARRGRDDRGNLPDVAERAHGEHGPREAPARVRAAADGRSRLYHPEGGGRGQRAADRARGSGSRHQLNRPLLRRRSPQGARNALRRQAALRERPRDADRPRRQAAGGGQPRAGRRAAPA